MMRTLSLFALAAACCVFGPVRAEIVEVPLPGLLGSYGADPVVRTATFALPRLPILINGATIRLSGTATVGAVTCEWGGPYPWMYELDAEMADPTTGGTWVAGMVTPEVAGEFVNTEGFAPRCCNPASWEFLMDGQGDIMLRGVPLGLVGLCQEITDPPEAVVTEAVLVLNAEFPVPTDVTTWGRIKGLYEQTR